MNQEEIKKILPHREHMLLIDEAELREARLTEKRPSAEMNFFCRVIFLKIPLYPV